MNCQINLFSIVNPSPFLLLSDWSTRIPAHKESLILLISQTTIELLSSHLIHSVILVILIPQRTHRSEEHTSELQSR